MCYPKNGINLFFTGHAGHILFGVTGIYLIFQGGNTDHEKLIQIGCCYTEKF